MYVWSYRTSKSGQSPDRFRDAGDTYVTPSSYRGGATVIVQPGSIGADFVTRKAPTILRAHGVSWVVRYITRGKSYKVLTPTERDELLAEGFGITLVWETGINAIDGGGPQGVLDGREAAKQATLLGYPPACDILAAVDTDVYSGNVVKCEAYLRAFHSNCHPYGMGIYADEDAFKAVADICGCWCLPNASGWSPNYRLWVKTQGREGRPFTGHILQGHEDKTLGMDIPNVCTKAFTAWSKAEAPAPIPKPTPPAPKPLPDLGGEMRNGIIRVTDDGTTFVGVLNDKGAALEVRWTGPGSPDVFRWLDAHRAAGAVDIEVRKQDLINCCLNGPVPSGWTPSDFAPPTRG